MHEEHGRAFTDFNDMESGTVGGNLPVGPWAGSLDDPIRIDQGHRLLARLIDRGERIPCLGQLDERNLG